MEQNDSIETHLEYFYDKISSAIKKCEMRSTLDPMTTLELAASVLLTIQMEVLDHIYQNFVIEEYKQEFKDYVSSHVAEATSAFFKDEAKPVAEKLGDLLPFKKPSPG